MRPCTQCGRCCLKYSKTNDTGLGQASELDLTVWEMFRPEVLDYVSGPLHQMWISPVTGKETLRCPWLRKLPNKEKYTCRIHNVRPEVCSDYPNDIDQMFLDGCEMLEDGDLDKPHKQLLAEMEVMRNAS